MKIAINSGLGDMVHFLPFAVELSEKGPLEIIGNKYSAEVCELAGLKNVTYDTAHAVMNPPPGAVVAQIKRYGNASLWWMRAVEFKKTADELRSLGWPTDAREIDAATKIVSSYATYEADRAKSYRQIYAEATGCEGAKERAWQALNIAPWQSDNETLLFDMPRASGLGSKLYTPNLADFSKELLNVSGKYKSIEPLTQKESLRELFCAVANASAGFGQIGFLTALCQLFDKPFYPVRGNSESDERFLARCRVVHL